MKYLFLSLLCALSLLTNAQKLEYIISHEDDVIGHMEVIKSAQDNIVSYDITSKVRVKMVLHVDISYKLHSVYKNGKLFFSSITTFVNGDVHSKTKVEQVGDYYSVHQDDHEKRYLKTIAHSSPMLYFEEPKKNGMVFSEFEGEDKLITSIGSHKYTFTKPHDSHKNTYIYKDGVMQSAIVENTMMDFKMTLKI